MTDNKIKVAIVVEVSISGSIRKIVFLKSPVPTFVSKGQVTVVAVHVIVHRSRRHGADQMKRVCRFIFFSFLKIIVPLVFQEIPVGVVTVVSVGNEKVLPAVVIIITKQRCPAPIGLGYPRELSDLTVCSITVVQVEHISHVLKIKAIENHEGIMLIVFRTVQ